MRAESTLERMLSRMHRSARQTVEAVWRQGARAREVIRLIQIGATNPGPPPLPCTEVWYHRDGTITVCRKPYDHGGSHGGPRVIERRGEVVRQWESFPNDGTSQEAER